MSKIDTLTTEFDANIIKLEEKLRKAISSTTNATNRIQRTHDQAADSVSKAWRKADLTSVMDKSVGGVTSLRSALMTIAPVMATAFSAHAVVAAMDSYTKFTNSLRVAGLEGANLANVQDALFQSAQKNGVALEPLSQLYGKVSTSAKELGASQADLLKFTDGVTAALRVNGGSTESASGALMQLSQALGGGTIRAEEFNSILEGAKPILEAVVAGNAKFGGSVSSLRNYMLAGKLTSTEFFEAFNLGSQMLEAKAAKAPLTVEASWQVLENALARAIGQFDATHGASEAMSNGITWLADNLDTCAEAIGVLAAATGGLLVANLGKAVATMVTTVAVQEAMTISAASAAVATRGLGAALAVVGGPWGVALTVIAGALGFLALKGKEASDATDKLGTNMSATNKAMAETQGAAKHAADQTAKHGDAATTAAGKAETLTGKLDGVAKSYRQIAEDARKAQIAMLDAAAEEQRANLREVDKAKADRKADRDRMATQGGGGMMGAGYAPMQQPKGAPKDAKYVDPLAKPRAPQVDPLDMREWLAKQALKDIDKRKEAVRSAPDSVFQPAKPTTVTKPDKDKKGRSAEDIARSDLSAITSAKHAELQAALSNAKTEEQRHTAQLDLLRYDHEQRLAAIALDKNISKEAKAALVKAENATNAAKLSGEATEHARNLAELEDDRLAAAREMAALQEDILDWQARNATTAADRARFESQALTSRQRRELDQIDADIKLADATGDLARATALRAQRPLIEQRQTQEREGQDRRAKRETGDWGQWWDDKFDGANINTELQGIADGGLASLTDGITSAIMGAKSLGAAFAETAKAIVADLVRIAVKFLVFESLGRAFGVKGLGAKAIGVTKTGGHVSGTDYSSGGLKLVGENGPELMMTPRGSQVAPNTLLRQALAAPTGGRTTITQNFTTVVHADNALVRSDLDRQIYQANLQTLQAARQMAAKDSSRTGRQKL